MTSHNTFGKKDTIFPKPHWATYWKVYRISAMLRHISWNYEDEKPIKGEWYDAWRIVNYEILSGDNRTPEYVREFKVTESQAEFLNDIYKKILSEVVITGESTYE
tara:strand:+ start:293 stop:607 length:315 start_codon:yes stop_codon:yes gene_type:complete